MTPETSVAPRLLRRSWTLLGSLLTLLGLAPAPLLSAAPSVPAEFEIHTFAAPPQVSYLTGLAFDGDGILYASEANVITGRGRVLRIEDRDHDGSAETIEEYATGFGLVTGITFLAPAPPKGAKLPRSARSLTNLERIRRGLHRGEALDLFVSHYEPGVGGTISVVRDLDRDGRAEQRVDVVTGLPSDGDNGNQQIAVGFEGRLYFGQGARTNSGVPGPGPADGPLNATILRVWPDGSGLEVYASGLRNAFDLAFTPEGELFASENGPDASGPSPVVGAPDELNAILEGGDYGWPGHTGFPPEDSGTLGPLAELAPGSSTDGIALSTSESFCGYEGDLFAAQFGSFTNPSIGRKLLRLRFVGRRGVLVESFASGFGRPLDVAIGPGGELWVADFSNAFFAPNSAAIYRIRPRDADADGRPDICP